MENTYKMNFGKWNLIEIRHLTCFPLLTRSGVEDLRNLHLDLILIYCV